MAINRPDDPAPDERMAEAAEQLAARALEMAQVLENINRARLAEGRETTTVEQLQERERRQRELAARVGLPVPAAPAGPSLTSADLERALRDRAQAEGQAAAAARRLVEEESRAVETRRLLAMGALGGDPAVRAGRRAEEQEVARFERDLARETARQGRERQREAREQAREEQALRREAAQVGREARRREEALAREQERQQREAQQEARQEARGTLARARHLAGLLETREEAREAQEAAEEARQGARAGRLATPGARAAYGAQSLRDEAREAVVRARRSQAEADYGDTPGGRVQDRRRAVADLERERADERRAKQQQTAEDKVRYGDTGAAVVGFRRDLSSLNPYVAAFKQALAEARSFAQAASPTHVKTFDDSLTLLKARIGSLVLPAFDELSRALQGAAQSLKEVRETAPNAWRAAQGFIGDTVRSWVDPKRSWMQGIAPGFPQALSAGQRIAQAAYDIPGVKQADDWSRDTWLGQQFEGSWLQRQAGKVTGDMRPDVLRSYAGLRGGDFYETGADLGRAAQQAALRTSPLEAEIMAEQARNIEESLRRLESIDRKLGEGWRFPTF